MPIAASSTLRSIESEAARRLPGARVQLGGVRALRLPDGRSLAWQTFGDPEGRPLYFFHGFPSCRLLASLVHEAAAATGIAVIAPDRPGFGLSTQKPDRTIAGWVDDVESLADRLGHDRFGVLGVSCGGPYALACARAIPDRLDYVGLMAGIGPMDVRGIRSHQLPPLKALFALARIHPVLASPILLVDAWLFRRNPAKAIAALSGLLTDPDREMLATNATVRSRFCASFVEAYRQGTGGARCEASLIAHLDRGILRGIEVPVHVYQGAVDRHVPPEMGRHIAASLPDGRLHLYADEGHLSILVNRFADCAVHFNDQPRARTEGAA